MAALGRPFSGLPLSGASDFLQPSPAFPGRAFPPGAADGAELAPRPGPRAAAPSSPGGSAARGRCPVRKKRLTEAALHAGPDDWILCAQQNVRGPGVSPCTGALSVPGMVDVVCEEMDETSAEAQCDVARRRLQELEDRIIDEDEEVESDRNVNHLPSLVLSDTMKTGLKRELDEVFTKKMIESMSRPSMELVLWKPLPELLSDKPKPLSNAKNYTGESKTKHSAAGTAFPQRTELFSEPQQAGMPLYSSLEIAANTEEEMEL
ncbi:coiled-coil domain-containing protein 117 isoform X2 [Ochotona curzoniae]|uniref:coiled-coil domain-containing protein 117 isoform X2 n=1 Tax=Ochotona curzoniae TaxID=130825 RepID=UPI001B345880|nr:coiled-coil domain-containing protein 117 isoform X2 [Ochotona curzoniae]